MKIEHIKMSIRDLRAKFAKLDFNPDYQRDYIWGGKNKQALLITLLLCGAPGLIYLRRRTEDRIFELLDGKQRMSTIRDFITDKIKILAVAQTELSRIDPKKYANIEGKKFSELPKELQDSVLDTIVDINHITQCAQLEASMFFELVQHGERISQGEDLNAILGLPRDICLKLLDSKAFGHVSGANHKRKGDLNLIAYLLWLEEQTELVERDQAEIAHLFRHGLKKDSKSASSLANTLKFMDRIFSHGGAEIKLKLPTQGFVALYWLIARDFNAFVGKDQKVFMFLGDFFARAANKNSADPNVLAWNDTRRITPEIRHRILRDEWLAYSTNKKVVVPAKITQPVAQAGNIPVQNDLLARLEILERALKKS